mmetsp:Transcript_73129/g.145037  ORF Transcript_73129/g.145037 Transcript_73129/m.145037 type:complete len:356 (+) Transcript_73129:83-1150(+)|eukprot:CAMPEP_0172804364 /NCGR_PEP_ID=MMETSP1075-20121228/5120_1 /TAXON_ID=2916 /ORGANISM="Ceratium fusus, Strain PA161109" /LENGTH=355 /DNA_ID=CAMNT_0013642933 /DNA_START=80 /DNA_END=1147 /DNA_ORIENTATION=+
MNAVAPRVLVFAAAISLALADAGTWRSDLRGSRSHSIELLFEDMQPRAVARSLARVETEWRSQALQFVECTRQAGHSDCSQARRPFQRSCSTIVNAVVSASSGDRPTVREYMATVCDEPELKGWRAERCLSFAHTVIGTMTADAWENRNHLNVDGVCNQIWSNMSRLEAANIAKEHALQAEKLHTERMEAARKEAKAKATAAAAKEAASAAAKRQKEAEARRKRKMEAKAALEAKRAAEAAVAAKAEEKRQAEKAAREAARRDEAQRKSQALREAAEREAQEAQAKLAEADHEEHEARLAIAAGKVVKKAKTQTHTITTGSALPVQPMHAQAVHMAKRSAANKAKVTSDAAKQKS